MSDSQAASKSMKQEKVKFKSTTHKEKAARRFAKDIARRGAELQDKNNDIDGDDISKG